MSNLETTNSEIELQCCICSEYFEDPIRLQCEHDFCLKCLEKYMKDKEIGEELPCPLCRKAFTIPKGRSGSMKRNEKLAKRVDMRLNSINCMKTRSFSCEICCDDESVLAVWRCLVCEQNFCDDDFNRHRKQKATKDHQIIKIESYLQTEPPIDNPDQTKCHEHPDRYLKLFCLPCEQVLCTDCFLENHNGHKYSKIEAMAEENRASLRDDIKQTFAELSRCQDNLRRIESDKESLMTNISRIEMSVNGKFQEIVSTFERHRDDFFTQLANVKDVKLKQLEQNKQEIESSMAQLNDLQIRLHDMANESILVTLACQAKDLHKTYLEQIHQIIVNSGVHSDVDEIVFLPSTVDAEDLFADVNVLGYVELASADHKIELCNIKEQVESEEVGKISSSTSKIHSTADVKLSIPDNNCNQKRMRNSNSSNSNSRGTQKKEDLDIRDTDLFEPFLDGMRITENKEPSEPSYEDHFAYTNYSNVQKSPNLEHPENEIQPGASTNKTRKNNLEIKIVEDCSLVLVGRKSKQAVTICLRFGDVLNQPGQNHTVVNSIYEPLLTKFMGKTLLSLAGKSVTEEVSEKLNSGAYQAGQVFNTKPGGLKPSIQYVLHAIGPDSARQSFRRTSTTLSSLFFKCFTFTNSYLPCSTIVVPPIGAASYDSEIVAKALLEALEEYDEYAAIMCQRGGNLKLRNIHVICNDSSVLRKIITTFKETISLSP